jgi:hypothetical protein
MIQHLEVLLDDQPPSSGHVLAADIFEAIRLVSHGSDTKISVRPTAQISTRAPIFTYQVENFPISTNSLLSFLTYRARKVTARFDGMSHAIDCVGATMNELEHSLLKRIAGIAGRKWLQQASAETDIYRNTKAVRLQMLYCIAHRMHKRGEKRVNWSVLSAAILADEDWQLRSSDFHFFVQD